MAHFTFPVWLLENGIEDIRNVASNIMDYCGYVQAEVEIGTQEERMEAAGHYFNVTWGNSKMVYDSGEELFEQTPEHSPMTSVSTGIVFDFYKNHKTEFETICFLAFAGIRSILQKKRYVKTTNEFLLARMAGRRMMDIQNLPQSFEKYLSNGEPKKYQFNKIKTELQDSWGLLYYAQKSRGFYVSFMGRIKFDDLVYNAEINRKSNKGILRKEAEKQAINKAKERIFKNNTITTPIKRKKP